MEKNNNKKQNVYISEEENVLKWEDVQSAFKNILEAEIYNSWLKSIF